MILSRDLGNGPHRPFGSALERIHSNDRFADLPRIGRTVKPQSAGPCKSCKETRYFCECEDEA